MIINGKEAKFHWGMIAFEVYQETIVQSKRKLSAFSVQSVTAILWGGILNHYERINEPCAFEYSEVYDHVERQAETGEEDKEISACVIAFNNSVSVQSAAEKLKDKKKVKKEKSLQVES